MNNLISKMIIYCKLQVEIYKGMKENKVPFYVTNEGGLYAKAEEVIQCKKVKDDLEIIKEVSNG